jgi:hypothetical protein
MRCGRFRARLHAQRPGQRLRQLDSFGRSSPTRLKPDASVSGAAGESGDVEASSGPATKTLFAEARSSRALKARRRRYGSRPEFWPQGQCNHPTPLSRRLFAVCGRSYCVSGRSRREERGNGYASQAADAYRSASGALSSRARSHTATRGRGSTYARRARALHGRFACRRALTGSAGGARRDASSVRHRSCMVAPPILRRRGRRDGRVDVRRRLRRDCRSVSDDLAEGSRRRRHPDASETGCDAAAAARNVGPDARDDTVGHRVDV